MIHSINWSDLPPPKLKPSPTRMSKHRARFKAWMREESYPMYLILVDHMAVTNPKYARVQTYGFIWPIMTLMRNFKGSNDESNGPNGETQCPTI